MSTIYGKYLTKNIAAFPCRQWGSEVSVSARCFRRREVGYIYSGCYFYNSSFYKKFFSLDSPPLFTYNY